MDELVEILLCEGGNVELGAQISKRIFVFAFDPLSLTLSLTLCIASYHSYLICLCLIMCHTCVKPRELHITPQLLFLEEIVQSPSPGIRLHYLVTHSVLQLSFNSASFALD